MNLRREISKALMARGFERNGRAHRLRLSDGFSFVVDTGPLGKDSDIAPWVMIRNDEVDRLESELSNLEYDGWGGHIGANVGCLNGNGYQTWENPVDKEEVLRAIDQAMDRLRPYLGLDRMADAWNAFRIPDEPIRIFREIPIMLLRGADDAAILRKLDEARPIHCKHGGPVTEQFLRFEARVRRRLAERGRA
jgi:hypothetical protein